MVFSSLIFLFAFLPITLFLYYITPYRKIRNLVLFILSLIFYAWGEPIYIAVMLVSILEAYICGLFIGKYREKNRKKAIFFMVLSISLNLASLIFFKYANFFIQNLKIIPLFSEISLIENLVLPIGISFYTFQIISYTVDLFWGRTEVQKNFVAFGTYVALFPQLIAGPIVRYRDVDNQLTERKETVDLFVSGIRRFVIGLSKKIILGDAAAAIYKYCMTASEFESTTLGAWMIMIFYTLHIYFDFSGYSDMAIGLGKMFGFKFLENFNYPYISASITEFWRRWHMSLGTWFKEYVYIPLGGNRKGKFKHYRNIAIVWLLTGFWHGASWNFVLWGGYFGLILMLEKAFLLRALDKIPKVFQCIYALFLVGVGWLIFSNTQIHDVFSSIGALFGVGTQSFTNSVINYQLMRSVPFLLVAVVSATPLGKMIYQKVLPQKENEDTLAADTLFKQIFYIATLLLVILLLVICIAYLVDSTFSPFLYFNF